MSVCSGEKQVRRFCRGVLIDERWAEDILGRHILDGWDVVHLPSGRCPVGDHTVEVREFGPWAAIEVSEPKEEK